VKRPITSSPHISYYRHNFGSGLTLSSHQHTIPERALYFTRVELLEHEVLRDALISRIGAEAVPGLNPIQGTNDAATPAAPSLLETSLIFELSWGMRARVKALRAHPSLAAHAVDLSEPHVTALFVGCLSRSLVKRLKLALVAPPHPAIDVELLGWANFERNDGTCNIHIRVKPEPSLIAVHQWALQVCRRVSWTPPADTSDDNYAPHITVADGRLDSVRVLGALAGADVPSRVTLTRLQLRSHPLQR